MLKITKKAVLGAALLGVSAMVTAGGNPDYVAYPAGYQQDMVNYAEINRKNGKQVAKMYADKATIAAYRAGKQAPEGSTVIMEVYKTKQDKNGKPVVGANGIFETTKLAAVAVMNLQSNSSLPADVRSGDWAFAFYGPDGKPKKNKLDCAACHNPLTQKQDFLFTQAQLKRYSSQH